jgi:exonuclease SbcC
MRHGARECSVRIETDDGHTIEWRRKDSPSYVIDGQVFERLKGRRPDELHAALRLPRVDAGDSTDFDVHFGTQKSPIFLLSGPANAARFFASSSDAIRLVAMQKRHKDKHATAQREKNRLQAESKRVNVALGILEPVVDLDERLAAAREAYNEVQGLARWVLAAEKGEAALRTQSARVHKFSALVGLLRQLSPPPEIVPAEPLQEFLAALLAAQWERDAAKSRADALAKLPFPPGMAPVEPLQNLIEAIVAAEAQLQAASSRADALRSLPQPPSLTPTEPSQTLIRATETEEERLGTAESRTRVLVTLKAPPELRDTSALDELTAAIVRFTRHQDRAKRESTTLSRISAPPQLDDDDPLSRIVERLAEYAREVSVWARTTRLLGVICEPPKLADESTLAVTLATVMRATRQVTRWERISSVLAAIAPVPAAVDTGGISDLISRAEISAAHVGACELALQTAVSRLSDAAADLRSKVEGNLCPICGTKLEADRVIARAAIGLGGHEHG